MLATTRVINPTAKNVRSELSIGFASYVFSA